MTFTRFSKWTVKYCPGEELRRGAEFTVTDVHQLRSGGKRTDMVAEWIPTGAIFHESETGQHFIVTRFRLFEQIAWEEPLKATRPERRPYANNNATDLLIGHTAHNRGGVRTSWKAIKVG